MGRIVFRFGSGVKVRGLVVMVKVRVGGWVIHYIDESPHKDGSTGVCVCVRQQSEICRDSNR